MGHAAKHGEPGETDHREDEVALLPEYVAQPGAEGNHDDVGNTVARHDPANLAERGTKRRLHIRERIGRLVGLVGNGRGAHCGRVGLSDFTTRTY